MNEEKRSVPIEYLMSNLHAAHDELIDAAELANPAVHAAHSKVVESWSSALNAALGDSNAMVKINLDSDAEAVWVQTESIRRILQRNKDGERVFYIVIDGGSFHETIMVKSLPSALRAMMGLEND